MRRTRAMQRTGTALTMQPTDDYIPCQAPRRRLPLQPEEA
jgi:hypothetical protein